MASTSEPGGSTTQAGIYFQNCITVLRLAGMLCGEAHAASRAGHIVAVRSEAPTEVDDTVVTWSDSRCEYIQAKLTVAPGDDTWRTLWHHFYAQYSRADFRREPGGDLLTLAVRPAPHLDELKTALERAAHSASAAEWWGQRLTGPGRTLLASVQALLGVSDPDAFFAFARCIQVWTLTFVDDPMETDSFAHRVAEMLRGVVEPSAKIFPVLMDLTSRKARVRGTLTREDLVHDLMGQGFRFVVSAPLSSHTLRAPVGDFTGRTTEIEALVSRLSQGGRIAAIIGMGGIGKTELALVVADRLREQYGDAALMFELQPDGTPLTPEAVLGAVIHAFHPEARLPEVLTEVQGLYRATLAKKRGLLLLDNAVGPEQVQPLLPAPEGWAVILTSRSRFMLPNGKLYPLDLLPLAEAVALLRGILSDSGRDELAEVDLAPLAKRCGRLPLALRVAASFLSAYADWPLPDYLAALKQAPLPHLNAPGEKPVQAVLGLSITALRKQDAVMVERWEQLAVFPATFDRAATAAVWGALGDVPAEDVSVWPEPVPLDEEETRQGLSALVQQSLLDHDAVSDSYTMHDLLRACALAAQTADLDAARLRHAWHYLRAGSTAEDLYLQGGAGVLAGLRQFEEAWPHLAAAWAWLRERSDAAARRWMRAYPDAVASVGDLRIALREKIAMREAAAHAAAILGDRSGEGVHLSNLGVVYAELGEVRRAIGLYQQALVIRREIRAASTERSAEWMAARQGEGIDFVNLGSAYWSLGEARRAIEYYEEALAIRREIGDRRGEGSALTGLGLACCALGEARRAIGLFEQALAISREIGDRRGEGHGLGNLGSAYWSLGEVRRAMEYHGGALAIHREIGDRHGEGGDLGNLGAAYHSLGEVVRAIGLYAERLVIAREIGDRRGEGDTLGNLGVAHKNLGEARRAIGFHEEALAISREIGNQSGQTNTLNNLGLAYVDLGETRQAIKCLKQALAISQEIGDRRNAGNAAWNLGLVYEGMRRYCEAAKLMQITVDFEREIGCPNAEENARRLEEVRQKVSTAVPDT